MWLWNIGVLLVMALGVWWLTGFDRTVSGESKRGHYFTRALRCLTVVFLVVVFLWFIRGGGGAAAAVLLLIIPISIALTLRSSLAEVFSGGLLRFVDPTLHDDRQLDFKKDQRYLDTIAHLIRQGRKDEVIRLCEELKKSGELDPITLEMTMGFLGASQSTKPVDPLRQAVQLRSQGNFSEAEALLKSLRAKTPSDVQVAILLMRVYAQDLRQPDKAREVLQAVARQPHVLPAHVEFARRSIEEWSQGKPAETNIEMPEAPKSPDDLIREKSYGSAVEMLEKQIKSHPHDFDLRIKLAEIHALHCYNLSRAEKIIRQLESDPAFSPEQAARAKAKLKVWKETEMQRK